MGKHLSSYPFRLLLCGVISVVVLAGCISKTVGEADTLRRKTFSGVKRIAVVPFQAIHSDDPEISFVRCPVCNTTFRTSAFTGTPEKRIEELFLERFTSLRGDCLISPGEVRPVYKRVSTILSGKPHVDILTKVGREIGADGVIAGYLFYYMEREGLDYSVETPASVAFCVHLVRVKDGMSIWKGVFDKTQSSLMENIFDIIPFIKGGGKWLTAEELSREGIAEILKDFPDAKGES